MGDRSLIYKITVAGSAEGIAALRTFNQQTQRLADEETRHVQTAVSRRVAARKGGVDLEQRLIQESFKRSLDTRNREVKEAERAAKQQAKNTDRAEKDKTRSVEREEKQRLRASEQAGKRIVDELNRQVRDFDRAEQEKTKSAEREAKKRANAAIREARKEAAFLQAERKKFFQGVGGAAGNGAATAFRTTSGMLMSGARTLSNSMGLTVGADVGNIVEEKMLVEQKLRQISIENRAPGAASSSFDEAAARNAIARAARKTGINQSALVGALDVYSEKGLGAQGAADIEKVAMQSKAIGVGPEVIAKIRAQLAISSGQAGQPLTSEQIDASVAKIAILGKSGVFRAGAIAEQSEALFSRFAASGGSFDEGLNKFIGFSEIARSATGSGSQAKTAIGQVQNAILGKESKINALQLNGKGIKTRDEDGTQSDFVNVMMDVIQATGGKGKALTDIFNVRAMGAVNPFISAFMNAGGAKNGEAGRAAMEKLLGNAMGPTSGMSSGALIADMNHDAADALETEGAKMAKTTEEIRQSLAEVIVPAMKKLGEALPTVVKWISAASGFATEHPLAAIGAVAGGAMVKGALPGLIGAGARFALGSIGGSGAGGVLGQFTGAIGGGTPVYITGAAPGVMGGEGGGALGGLAGGAQGMALIGLIAAAGALTAVAVDWAHDHGGGKGPDGGRPETPAEAAQRAVFERIHGGRATFNGATGEWHSLEDGLVATLEGKETPEEIKKKELAAKMVEDADPALAAAVKAGILTPEEAARFAKENANGTSANSPIANEFVTTTPLNFKRGPDGNLETSSVNSQKSAKELEAAFTTLKQAADALGDAMKKINANASLIKQPPGK